MPNSKAKAKKAYAMADAAGAGRATKYHHRVPERISDKQNRYDHRNTYTLNETDLIFE